jgi:hypothetical protein
MSEIQIPDYSRALGQINANLQVVSSQVEQATHNINVVSGQVETVAREQTVTRGRLEELYAEFQEFVAADARQKERQFAATRIIEVRQEVQKRFGHYDEVRRHTTGVLQASDLALVRQDTMRTRSEELMMSCPGYWLAPGLVALVGWIGDSRELAERALAEALKRDDSKASLFFSLVCRRARRMEACARWLLRYFQMQNPAAMDREVVVMLDALANGVFGGAALTTCSAVIDEWLGELEEQAGFPAEQRKRWAEAMEVKLPKAGPDEYPTLRKFSSTWPRLEAALTAARRNQVILTFFEDMFTGEIVVPPSLESAVDGILATLVTRFDDEELPLRRDERMLQLIVDEGGDKKAAERRYAAESDALEEQTNFAAMLTNSAMNPELNGATRATQRYAVSRSRHWIIAGFQDLVARYRAQIPAEAEITCGSWTGTSRDGSNQGELDPALHAHYLNRIEQAVAAVSITMGTWAALIIGGLIGLVITLSTLSAPGAGTIIGVLVMAGAGFYFYTQYKNLDNIRRATREALEKERDDASRILKASLAELADLRRDIQAEDAKSAKVVELLSSLSSPQFVLKRPEQARAMVN